MKKMLILITAVLSFTSIADSSVGCGAGSLLIKRNSIVSALFRATTNHSFSSQLFGITTGTSGCSKHSIVQVDKAPVHYAEANIENLKVEFALGQGEYLTSFAQTLGCQEKDQRLFNKVTKSNYSTIFNKEEITPHEMLGNVKKVIISNDELRASCPLAII